ncbi:MAG: hypothetical protein K8S14_06755 [Actinomycetia bacterium]|nr:hypothetical protein [Actinomycetes bacterium]
MKFDDSGIDMALSMLDGRLRLNDSPSVRLVVCSGSALIAMDLVQRTTDDVDVVALVDSMGCLVSPAAFPAYLNKAIREVGLVLELPEHWLNNGPSSDERGLFQTGLPDGLFSRAHRMDYGSHLTVFSICRIDQIFFKVFAAADSLGVHVDDLTALNPSSTEMENAARWCMKCDPSEGFRQILVSMLQQLGYGDVTERL